VNVANILGHAARLARLGPASFPTVYNPAAAAYPDSQLAVASLLAQLIAMVNDLGASVTFLTSQVETLTSTQAERSPPPHHQPYPTWRGPSRTCPLVLLLPPYTAPHKWQRRCLQRHPLPPLLSKLNLLSRKRNSPPASRLVRMPPRIFPSFLRENGIVTRKNTPNATWTHPKQLSFWPLAIPRQRKPNFALSGTQPPHFSIAVPPPVSLFLIPHSPKNKPGQRLPGRALRARKAPLQHKSLRQARVVSPKDPHRSRLLNLISLPRTPPHASRTIRSS